MVYRADDTRDIPSGPDVWPAAPGWWTRSGGCGWPIMEVLALALLILAVNGEEHPSWLLAHTLMEDFRSQVSGPIQEAYPEDYVESRRKSGGMLSFSIGLHSDSHEGIE